MGAQEDGVDPAFWLLRESRFDFQSGAEWDAYYAKMAPHTEHDNFRIRDSAIERLCMAVFRSEPMRAPYRERDFDAMLKRALWLRGVIEAAAARHADVKSAVVGHMRYHGDDEPFAPMVVNWFRDWLDEETDAELRDQIRGVIVLHEPQEDSQSSLAHLIALLDDPSDYVRACAAKMLGECPERLMPPTEIFGLIAAKDIARPGVAGPFWSARRWTNDGAPDPAEWMLNILARRSGPEPDNLPFNGVDFHLHELCDHSPRQVARMIDLGHKFLVDKI